MKIIKPSDWVLLGKLERKLAEYQRRDGVIPPGAPLTEVGEDYFVGEAATSTHTHRAYKREILQAVLAEGVIDVDKFREAYVARNGEVVDNLFRDAARVIESYCRNATKEILGGTGLK